MFALANIEAANRWHFLQAAIVGELTTPEKG
jgi:hypothetical protein